MLPEGWPTAEIWQKMQEWAGRRYLGDNGLMGSDFFDGQWVKLEMPSDVHRAMGQPLETGIELEALGLGDRMSKRRDARREGDAPAPIRAPRI